MIHKEVLEVLSEAKVLALRFCWQTGKPLGVIGEVAKYEAARKLGLSASIAYSHSKCLVRRGLCRSRSYRSD